MTPLVLALLVSPPAYTDEVVDRWRQIDPALQVEIVAYQCGDVNAFYDREANRVELCSELFADPSLTRGILNHELAHAFFDQHGLDELLGAAEEFNADELGFFFMTRDEITAVEGWMLDMAAQYPKPFPGDTHPHFLDRAAMFLCLESAAYEGDIRACNAYLRSAYDKWSVLVLLPRTE